MLPGGWYAKHAGCDGSSTTMGVGQRSCSPMRRRGTNDLAAAPARTLVLPAGDSAAIETGRPMTETKWRIAEESERFISILTQDTHEVSLAALDRLTDGGLRIVSVRPEMHSFGPSLNLIPMVRVIAEKGAPAMGCSSFREMLV